MGCIHSSTNNDDLPLPNSNIVNQNSSLSIAEQMEIKTILSNIPENYRGVIKNIPPRQLLNIYQRHFLALHYLGEKNFVAAIAHEYQVLKELEPLMINHPDHYIYIEIYNVMSICFRELNARPTALQIGRSVMALLLKYTPMDHIAIKSQFFYLAMLYQLEKEWANAEYCLSEAINRAKQIDPPDHENIQLLEKHLDLIKLVNECLSKMTLTKVIPKPGETDDQRRRRAIREVTEFNAEHGTLSIDKSEYDRLPLKETESLVNDQILNEVFVELKSFFSKSLSESEERRFVAAEFKHAQMKESPLSPAIIEAALTIIFDQINNDEKYTSLKQLPYLFSYTHDDFFNQLGVRVFLAKPISNSSQK